MKPDFKGKKIGVLGLGIEGLSSALYLREKGAAVTVFDKQPEASFERERLKHLEELGIAFFLGIEPSSHLQEFDMIVRSPGVKIPPEVRDELTKKKVQITSQTQLFLELSPARVIGVTGTKGKGTTSALIYDMLKSSGIDAYLGGNIGTPPFSFLDALRENSVVVLELSSFQLSDVTKSPHIAVLLMIIPDHLHYHGDMSQYIDAKRNILKFQTAEDFAIINRDYIASNESDIHTAGTVYYVSRERPSTEQGCFIKDDAVWIRLKGAEWKIIDTKDVALPGKHNLENACAAAMAATLAGATKSEISQTLSSFKGLPHRIELVREVNDVHYYDDSIATNPESTIAAIESFDRPKILILGGVTEGSEFAALGQAIAKDRTIKAIIGIGKEWPTIKAAIEKAKPFEHLLFIEGATSMEQVVQAAAKLARPGDVVLLSPACKSFDMFKSYQDRGDQFKEAVNKLSKEQRA